MVTSIPEQFQGSAALQFIQSRGWNWKPSNFPNIELEECPYCNKSNYGHLYMEIHGTVEDADQRKRDGLHNCHRCGKGGSLYSLKEHLGVAIPGVQSQGSWAAGEKKVDVLPDVEAAHQLLLQDEDALDYLINGRGFSMEIIQRQKLGLSPKKFFRETGEVRALIYPYLVNGNCVFAHYRTLPTMPLTENKVVKAFSSPSGWDAPLYNAGVLLPGLKDVIFVEGEANCIAAMDHGVDDICGVPGANFKKADWIDTLDKLGDIRIYICYDNDRVGKKAAQVLASRIGVEKCWKMILPHFEFSDPETGETRVGKDLNEWFVHGGGTAEALQQLKEDAVLFDVDGVNSAGDALQELEEQILGKGVEAKYKFPWASLNRYLTVDEGDVIDIIAAEKIGKTTFGLNIIEHMVNEYGDDGIVICLEMTNAKMARKWVSHVTGLADDLPTTPEEAQRLKQGFLKAIPEARARQANRSGTIYFCYPIYRTVDDIYKLMRDVIRRYGVKWIMFDNLQRLCDTTLGAKNRTQHLSEISKETSRIAKDYKIQMLRIVQPHRVKQGAMVTTDNTDGASQVMKDCDGAITLNRNRVGELSMQQFETMPFAECEATFDDKMHTGVGLTRYSAGGYTTLFYDGARSSVSEFNIAQIAKIKAEANKHVGYEAQLQALNVLPVKTDTPPEPQPGDITI